MITGMGSSVVGFIVVVTKELGEWVLEVGVLVLVDGGVCCIDEFDFICEVEWVMIYEVME